MKNYLILLCFLLPFITTAQNQSGKIIYKVERIEESSNPIDSVTDESEAEAQSFMAREMGKREKGLPHLNFELVFNKGESLFNHPPTMEPDEGIDLAKSIGMVNAKGKYYTNIKKNTILEQKKLHKLVLLQKKVSDLEWTIEEETKTIAGYECQKATTRIYINSRQNNKKVTAWFTKDLPFQFGPAEMVGLPGMVLGYEKGKFFIYADEINLSKKNQKIKQPSKGVKFTIEDLIELDKDIAENPTKYMSEPD